MSGHSRTSQALKQVYLLYGKSWFVCVVRHGFQQTKNKVKCKSKYFSSIVPCGTWKAPYMQERSIPVQLFRSHMTEMAAQQSTSKQAQQATSHERNSRYVAEGPIFFEALKQHFSFLLVFPTPSTINLQLLPFSF